MLRQVLQVVTDSKRIHYVNNLKNNLKINLEEYPKIYCIDKIYIDKIYIEVSFFR